MSDFSIKMTDEELKSCSPCPFCSGHDLSHYSPTGSGWVRCNNCGAEGPAHQRPPKWIEAWNRRDTIKKEVWYV